MADEIIDIITQLTFDVKDADLQKVAIELTNQLKQLGLYATQLDRLQRLFNTTSTNEVDKRQRIANLIQRQKTLIDQTSTSIQKQVGENKKLQDAIVRETGLVNTLRLKLKDLEQQRNKAFSVKEARQFAQQMATVQGQIDRITNPKGNNVLGKIGGSILQGFGAGAGFGLFTQGVSAFREFIGEGIRLAEETEGVSRAFDRLNDPNLLQNLREATRGTVTDLELMKKAVEFNNFGLPVEKLGVALGFARQRANDTGQSVDYLVNSIVTGVGRQSPLILDNLGINAKRVADRFKETGDFAQAAFEIIQEESAKSGDALDTFSDKQAQLNARIKNQQAEVGQTFTQLSLLSKSFIADFFTEGNFALTRAAIEFTKQQDELARQDRIRKQENIKSLDEFINEYANTDLLGRHIIEAQAEESYNELLRLQQQFFNQGQFTTGEALQGQIDQYKDYFSKLREINGGTGKVSFKTFNNKDLLGLTQDELKALKEEGENSLNPLQAGDTKGIAAINARIKMIDDALARFSLKVEKRKQEVKKKAIRPKDILDLSPEEQQQELDELSGFITKIQKVFDDRKASMSKNQDALGQTGTSTYSPTGSNTGDIIYSEDELISSRNDAERENKAKEESDRIAKEARDQRVQQEKEAFQSIAQAAIQAYNIITDAQIRNKDIEIRVREQRVQAALELAKTGNTELLKMEQERLDESVKERERYARRQAVINAALTVSQSVLAVATAAGETGAGAIAIVPALIAVLAAGFAAASQLSNNPSQGFKDGVVDLQGPGTSTSDSIPARLSKGESVVTAAATAKYKDVLTAMNTEQDIYQLKPGVGVTNNYATSVKVAGIEKRLDALITLNESNTVNVRQVMDGEGLTQLVERTNRKMNSRHKRG